MRRALPPGATIGMIGGGQLGRMLGLAAARLGYRMVVLEPQPGCPAAQTSNRQLAASYDDAGALDELASVSAVVSYEFENVPIESAKRLARRVPVLPTPKALEVSQDRLVEKRFLRSLGLATADFQPIDSDGELEEALQAFGRRGLLKTRRLGYDGKGQRLFKGAAADQVTGAHAALGGVPLILESVVPFEREISVIAARSADGRVTAYDPAENVHRDGILHSSTVPARVAPELARAAQEATATILQALDYVGVIGVEFFAMADGGLVVNEIAPRVHNSGHWTEAACAVSQFEQHIRAICGLPLGSAKRHADCVMENLIGEDIERAGELLGEPGLVLHLYGKAETRPGRKMGHFARLSNPEPRGQPATLMGAEASPAR